MTSVNNEDSQLVKICYRAEMWAAMVFSGLDSRFRLLPLKFIYIYSILKSAMEKILKTSRRLPCAYVGE